MAGCQWWHIEQMVRGWPEMAKDINSYARVQLCATSNLRYISMVENLYSLKMASYLWWHVERMVRGWLEMAGDINSHAWVQWAETSNVRYMIFRNYELTCTQWLRFSKMVFVRSLQAAVWTVNLCLFLSLNSTSVVNCCLFIGVGGISVESLFSLLQYFGDAL